MLKESFENETLLSDRDKNAKELCRKRDKYSMRLDCSVAGLVMLSFVGLCQLAPYFSALFMGVTIYF
jgi:hypothetical protein